MLNDWLPYEEQDALKCILTAHGVDDPELTKDLAAFCNWQKMNESDKVQLNRVPRAPFLISFLGMRGLLHKKKAPA